MEYGFISLLPVLVILIIAVATKRTLFAMTCWSDSRQQLFWQAQMKDL